MADINPGSAGSPHGPGAYRGAAGTPVVGAGAQAVVDESLIAVVELMFFAYRDFTGEADAVLQELEFGRAHHRVLHFVNRRPGLRVADLLDILRITKQSLARTLKQLVDRGYIAQEAGAHDRRERRLYVTPKGSALAARLAELQTQRIGKALADAGGSGGAGEAAVRSFLLAMITPEQNASIAPAAPAYEAGSAGPMGEGGPPAAGCEAPQGRPRSRETR
jgi:DNA-binding MarR family transcriptional regulator